MSMAQTPCCIILQFSGICHYRDHCAPRQSWRIRVLRTNQLILTDTTEYICHQFTFIAFCKTSIQCRRIRYADMAEFYLKKEKRLISCLATQTSEIMNCPPLIIYELSFLWSEETIPISARWFS